MLSLIFVVCIEKELNQHLMTPNYNATHFNIFHHTGVLASEVPWRPMIGGRGARDGAVVRALAFHQCSPGSNPGVDAICGLSLFLVLFFAWRGFSGYSSFPLSSNTNISKFQFDKESSRRRTILWICCIQIVILFIFIFLMMR